MCSSRPRAVRLPRALLLAATSVFHLPSLLAGDSLLHPIPPLPGESGSPNQMGELPHFLRPANAADTASEGIRPPAGRTPNAGWIGDSWIWNTDQTNGFESVRIPTAAEQHFAELDWWRRNFARMTAILMACAAITAFAVLVARAVRR